MLVFSRSARNNLTSGDQKRNWAFRKKRRARPFSGCSSNPVDVSCRRHCMLHQMSPSSFCCLCSGPSYL